MSRFDHYKSKIFTKLSKILLMKTMLRIHSKPGQKFTKTYIVQWHLRCLRERKHCSLTLLLPQLATSHDEFFFYFSTCTPFFQTLPSHLTSFCLIWKRVKKVSILQRFFFSKWQIFFNHTYSLSIRAFNECQPFRKPTLLKVA